MAATEDAGKLAGKFPGGITKTTEFRGETTIHVTAEVFPGVMKTCRDGLGYAMLLDVSSLDHFGDDPRFEMVYELATLDDKKHLRVRLPVGEEENVPSVANLWAAADWHEREVYDMMGIHFSGHPDMRRILMWEGYPFHPLRKDFPLAGRPSEMPDVAFTGVAPLVGGPFVTSAGAPDVVRREPRSREME